MANIKTFLEKEFMKGNTLVHRDGTITSYQNVKIKLEKEYRKGIAKGEIPLEKSFTEYEHDCMEEYTQIDTVLSDLEQSGIIWRNSETSESN